MALRSNAGDRKLSPQTLAKLRDLEKRRCAMRGLAERLQMVGELWMRTVEVLEKSHELSSRLSHVEPDIRLEPIDQLFVTVVSKIDSMESSLIDLKNLITLSQPTSKHRALNFRRMPTLVTDLRLERLSRQSTEAAANELLRRFNRNFSAVSRSLDRFEEEVRSLS